LGFLESVLRGDGLEICEVGMSTLPSKTLEVPTGETPRSGVEDVLEKRKGVGCSTVLLLSRSETRPSTSTSVMDLPALSVRNSFTVSIFCREEEETGKA